MIKKYMAIAVMGLFFNSSYTSDGTSACTKKGTYNKTVLALVRTKAPTPVEFFSRGDMPRLGQLVAYARGTTYCHGVVNKIDPGFVEIITRINKACCRHPFKNGWSSRSLPVEASNIGKIAPEQNLFMEIQDDETDISSDDVGSADES